MVQEVIFLRKFLHNLGFPQTAPTPVFADNETCIAWSEGSVGGSERAKHVDPRTDTGVGMPSRLLVESLRWPALPRASRAVV
jgi:hypothetical protein